MRRAPTHLNQLPLHNHKFCAGLNNVAIVLALIAFDDSDMYINLVHRIICNFLEVDDHLNHCQVVASGLVIVRL